MASSWAVNVRSRLVNLAISADLGCNRQGAQIKPKQHNTYTAFFCLTTDRVINRQTRGLREGQRRTTPLSDAMMTRVNPLSGA